jgi:hypothetical protein
MIDAASTNGTKRKIGVAHRKLEIEHPHIEPASCLKYPKRDILARKHSSYQ